MGTNLPSVENFDSLSAWKFQSGSYLNDALSEASSRPLDSRCTITLDIMEIPLKVLWVAAGIIEIVTSSVALPAGAEPRS